ncbi:MAG: carboxypeptidase regulatory-like domain-containing protein [Candidatus Cloacimonadota bacterium]|nr:MAG: carboxypeptidase regulatory-like domain-containing protein [Candidatus Cloacimonadota bacterium]
MKKGILPLIFIIAVSLIVALSCEKVKEEILQVTIRGTVTNGGQPVAGAFVLLLDNDEMATGFPIGNASITAGNGDYTIIRVEDGTYYVAAVKDENGNEAYDFGVDPIGWYGHDSFGIIIPDPVVVSGEDVSGIDIDTMYVQ